MNWIELKKNDKTTCYINFSNVDYFEIDDWSDSVCELTIYEDNMPRKLLLRKCEWERVKNKIYS